MYFKKKLVFLIYVLFSFCHLPLTAGGFPKDFIEDTPRLQHPLLIKSWEKAQNFINGLRKHSTTEDNFVEFQDLILEGIKNAKTFFNPNDLKQKRLDDLGEEVVSDVEQGRLTLPKIAYLSLKIAMLIDPKHPLPHLHSFFEKESSKGWDYAQFSGEILRKNESNLMPFVKQNTIPQFPLIGPEAHFGLQTWNFSWVNGILPIGIPLKMTGYTHGQKYTAWQSILHDLQHNFSHTLNEDDFQERRSLFRGIYQSILKEENGEDFKKGQVGFFLINHEFTPRPIRIKGLTDNQYYKAYIDDMWKMLRQGFRQSFKEALDIDLEILRSFYPQAQLSLIYDEEKEVIHIKGEEISDIKKRIIDSTSPFRKKTDATIQLERLLNYTDYVPLLEFVGYPSKDKTLVAMLRKNDTAEIDRNQTQLIELYTAIRYEVIDLLEWFEKRYSTDKQANAKLH